MGLDKDELRRALTARVMQATKAGGTQNTNNSKNMNGIAITLIPTFPILHFIKICLRKICREKISYDNYGILRQKPRQLKQLCMKGAWFFCKQ
jgi:uncharacterized protein HemY